MAFDEILDRRACTIFDLADLDHDGVIVASDYLRVTRHLLEEYGVTSDSLEGRTALLTRGVVWKRYTQCIGVSPDEQINREQFRHYFAESMRGDEAHGKLFPMLRAEFDIADSDDDGSLTQDEFVRWRGVHRISQDIATKGFRVIDSDEDGRISYDDYITMCYSYLENTDLADVEKRRILAQT